MRDFTNTDPDPPPKGWPLTVPGYADPEFSRETRWQDDYYEFEAPKGEHLPILHEPDTSQTVLAEDANDSDASDPTPLSGPAGGRIGKQDSAEPYAHYETIDHVPSRTARGPQKFDSEEKRMLARITKTTEEKQTEQIELLKIQLVSLHFENRPGKMPNPVPLFSFSEPKAGLVPRVSSSKPYVPCDKSRPKNIVAERTKHCRCVEPCGLRATPIESTVWRIRQRDGLHRTGTFKLVARVGRLFTDEEIVASFELGKDERFLDYLQPWPAFLPKPRRRFVLDKPHATSFRPLWSISKFSNKGRQYFSDDPAEGALPLDGTHYVCHKPFNDFEKELRALRQEDLSNEQIAERLRISIQTVKNWLGGQKAFAEVKVSEANRPYAPLFFWPKHETGAYYTYETAPLKGIVKGTQDDDLLIDKHKGLGLWHLRENFYKVPRRYWVARRHFDRWEGGERRATVRPAFREPKQGLYPAPQIAGRCRHGLTLRTCAICKELEVYVTLCIPIVYDRRSDQITSKTDG